MTKIVFGFNIFEVSKLFYRSLGTNETWPNISIFHPASLTFDDVLLVPQNSKVSSRKEIDTSVQFGPYTLEKPLITAPMDTISGEKMIRELGRLGAIGTLPRGDLKERLEICERLTNDNIPCLYAVGLKNAYEEANELKSKGAKVILLDVAHGGMEKVVEMGRKIKEELGLYVVAGNIVTFDQAKSYKENKIDYARVGVGPGGLCITRLVAGSGFPQLSAILEATESGINVIADGGIRKPADFAKAIASGASVVMMGSIFSGTNETPGDVIEGDKKNVRGQASLEYMKDNGVENGEFRSAEGVSIEVPLKGPVENVINDLMGGLRSAMSYAGAQTIKEFQEKAVFTLITSSSRDESVPWMSEYKV